MSRRMTDRIRCWSGAIFNPHEVKHTMARIDDYHHAKQLAVKELAPKPLNELTSRGGFEPVDAASFEVHFLDRSYHVHCPEFAFVDRKEPSREVPMQEQILILHYLMAPDIPELSGKWVSYREIPGASFYFSVFVKRAVDPLKTVFGRNIARLAAAAETLNGKAIASGDAGFEFLLFPKVPVRLIVWEGDEEFTPEANIVFDATVGRIFSPEDIAWLAGMLVYRLIALAKERR